MLFRFQNGRYKVFVVVDTVLLNPLPQNRNKISKVSIPGNSELCVWNFLMQHIVTARRVDKERKKKKKEKYAVFQKCVLALSGTFGDM